jgi:hypothetical protein
MLRAICNFPIVNLKEYVRNCSKINKIASEMHKMLKKFLVTMPQEEHRNLSGFPNANMGKI